MAFPRAELSPEAVSRWERLEQVRAGRAGSSAREIPAGRGFLPKFHPSLKSSCSFSGVQALSQTLLQLLPAWALLSLGSGRFYRAAVTDIFYEQSFP